MKWFGKSYGAAYEADMPHVAAVIDEECQHCGEEIEADDDGFLMTVFGIREIKEHAYHYECHMRRIVGGYNHLVSECTCCGGTEPPDPPELTRRQAAREALSAWMRRRA